MGGILGDGLAASSPLAVLDPSLKMGVTKGDHLGGGWSLVGET